AFHDPASVRFYDLALHDALPISKPLLALLFIALPLVSFGQDKTINLEQAIEIGLSNNASAKASALRIDEALALKKSSWDIDKTRSEEHTSELQSRENLVCRLLLE